MAKRSPVDQLDQAVQALLASTDSVPPSRVSELAALLRIAADLRELPREEFKARLKTDLERKASMTTATATYVPSKDFHTLTPYLIVKGASKLFDFCLQAFGAEEKGRVPLPDGTVQHAEIQIGDSMVEMGDAGGKWAPMPAALHLYVPDADAVYERAIAAGATSLYAPMDQPYGDREGGITDPCGNSWYIATHRATGLAPEGFRSVTLGLQVRGSGGMLDFLKQAFSAEETLCERTPDGNIRHAMLRIGDSVVELGEAHGPFRPLRCGIHMYVPDADAVYERALAAGGKSVYPMTDQPYGERSGGVEDAWGNQWYIATYTGH
ncbi:MAG: VOC family protein [Acidobacteria bacterium]|nr:VOC family protein [Acidobacteriota bacterium]